ncbi:MAG: hypothetical protein AAB074_22080 [Planctomycetota bacterium]
MKPMSAVGLALSVVACVAMGWASSKLSALSGSIRALDTRVAALEGGGGGEDPGPANDDSGRLRDEMVRLQSELADIREFQKKLGVSGTGDGPTLADLRKALEEILQEKELAARRSRAEKDLVKARAHNAGLHKTIVAQMKMSEAQAAHLKDILDAQVEAYRSLLIERAQDFEMKARELNKATSGKIKEILVEEQKPYWDPSKVKWFIDTPD